MNKYSFRVELVTTKNYVVDVYAESEEQTWDILDDECWNWDSMGTGENVVMKSDNTQTSTEYFPRRIKERNDSDESTTKSS